MARWRVRLSRRLNGALGHDPSEMVCTRLLRARSRWCWPINVVWLLLFADWRHCRSAAQEDEADRRGSGVSDGLDRTGL